MRTCTVSQEEDEDEQPQPQQQRPQQQPEPAAKRTASSCDDEGPSTSGAAAEAAEAGRQHKKAKFSKLGKDPGVLTNFLPDKDRELQEEELRQQLKKVIEGQVSSVQPAAVAAAG